MKNNDYLREQQDRLTRARESARVLDQLVAAQAARETADGKKRIAPQRVDPPLLRPTPPARPDPFLQAIARRLQIGR